jgi:cyclophilin family peptidyl-prolyl cis-trans isomerase
MVKKGGRKHTNETQFYITLNPISAFDKNFVAFGRVIMGFKSMSEIEKEETNLQRPINEIKIVKCGEYTLK